MIVAFVHAKKESKRVKNKNIRLLGGIPLFVHSILNSLNCKLIDKVIIDSDSNTILDIGESYGATKLRRPQILATNNITGDELAYWQATNYPNSDIVLQVVPTSPFITPKTLQNAILALRNSNSVVGVRKEKLYIWKDNKPIYGDKIPNSYELEDTIFETTGLYINRTNFVLNNKKRIDKNNCNLFELSKIESLDINTKEDLEFARVVWKGLNK